MRATLPGLPLFQIVALALIFLGASAQLDLRAEGPKAESAQGKSSLTIDLLYPGTTTAGQAFNKQPDGASAIAVGCRGATRSTVIVFAGEKLPTVYGSPTSVSAKVPGRFYSKSGSYDVYLTNPPGQKSNVVKFTVH